MVFFCTYNVIGYFSMIRKKKVVTEKENIESNDDHKFYYLLNTLEGLGVGLVNGIVVASGGFLIKPALVLLVK